MEVPLIIICIALAAAVLVLILLLQKERGARKKTEQALTETIGSQAARQELETERTVLAISESVRSGEIPSGVILLRAEPRRVYCSEYAVGLLGWPERLIGFGGEYDAVSELLGELLSCLDEGCETAARSVDGKAVWVEICRHWQDKTLILTVKDITGAVEAKKRELYAERHDTLTGFFNHRTFLDKLQELFCEKDRIGIACMVLFELESIKVINDNYGYFYVDDYIKLFTEILKGYSASGFFSRHSNSEFFGFFYGYPSEDSLRQTIEKLWKDIKKASIRIGEREKVLPLKVSAGVAWYPRDSEDPSELMTYANFTAYVGQRTTAERLLEFSRERYQKDGYLINCREAFIRFVENKLVRYAFQPIVDVATAKVYGYEMLMRPQLPELRSPGDVLNIARMQSKLHIIESMTWFEGMSTFAEQVERGVIPYNTRVFLNSIGGAVLSQEELEQFYEKYFDYLKNLIIEITEAEQNDDENIRIKREMAQKWKAQMAIDDYGTGFNSEASLLYFQPSIVKVDMTIVQGVDRDTDRQNLLDNLIRYAKRKDIRVLAEGVMTREELKAVIGHGVDYVQGYYLAEPGFTPRDITARLKREIGEFRHGM